MLEFGKNNIHFGQPITRLARFFSYIHHTTNYKQYCHVGNQAIDYIVGLFQDADLTGNLKRNKINFRWRSLHMWTYMCANFMGLLKLYKTTDSDKMMQNKSLDGLNIAEQVDRRRTFAADWVKGDGVSSTDRQTCAVRWPSDQSARSSHCSSGPDGF